MTLPAAVPNDEAIRQAVQAVLQRPEFSPQAPPWYVGLLRWLGECSERLSHWTAEHPVLGWLLISLLFVVLVALLVHIIYVALGDLWPWRRGASGRRSAASVWSVLEGTADSWAGALRRAREALATGDLRRVVWISHRVLLGLLDERGALRFVAGKTNTDYLTECPADHPWRQALAGLSELYDRSVYAHRAVAREVVEQSLGQVESCLEPIAREA